MRPSQPWLDAPAQGGTLLGDSQESVDARSVARRPAIYQTRAVITAALTLHLQGTGPKFLKRSTSQCIRRHV